MDPDSSHQEADARRLFEGMLQALSDVSRGWEWERGAYRRTGFKCSN